MIHLPVTAGFMAWEGSTTPGPRHYGRAGSTPRPGRRSQVTAATDGTTTRALIDSAIGDLLREIPKPTPPLRTQGEL